MDLVGSPKALRAWAIASLVANMALIVTGGLVRVTGSGLGCSTWPQCEPGSYVPHGDAPLHAYIEFGNRMLTFVLVAVAIGTFVAAWKARDAAGRPVTRFRLLAGLAAAGIPAQAIIGGISVLAQLEWWVVGLHLLPSLALIMVCTVLVHEVHAAPPADATVAARYAAWTVLVLGWVVMLLGVVVTGAGPNAGGRVARRCDPRRRGRGPQRLRPDSRRPAARDGGVGSGHRHRSVGLARASHPSALPRHVAPARCGRPAGSRGLCPVLPGRAAGIGGSAHAGHRPVLRRSGQHLVALPSESRVVRIWLVHRRVKLRRLGEDRGDQKISGSTAAAMKTIAR